MHIVCERFEPQAVLCGRKAVDVWLEATVCVDLIVGIFPIALGSWIGDKPLHVNGDVLPARSLQMSGHPICVSFDLLFIDCRTVRIPTVPAHRWRRGGAAGISVHRG